MVWIADDHVVCRPNGPAGRLIVIIVVIYRYTPTPGSARSGN